MLSTVQKLPKYLQRYCTIQDEGRYTPVDHAVWRFIMRQSLDFFRDHAVPIYSEGLRRTGITLDRIPLIREMDKQLAELGWGAVPVQGFIPPAAFLDFQARRILPIAYDMRSLAHLHYTPAPDIVHEAAGHAPILADPAYSDYITMYAAMAQKALFARHDLDLYEAIRRLSDLKENPDSGAEDIAAAEERLQLATQACSFVSEAAKVARMNWWTVEYGLLGSIQAPKIYGAGLLSSVGESQACLSAKVEKRRLTASCIDTPYNITEPQPQLFVAESISHLVQVLQEFESTLAYRRGGLWGLAEAQRCATLATLTLSSGLQISGVVQDYLASSSGGVGFVRLSGPVQLAYSGRELPGHGVTHHAQGFSTPLGRIVELADIPPERLSEQQWRTLGVVAGSNARLNLVGGFVIQGRVHSLLSREGKTLSVKWQDCTVTKGDQLYFKPEWGDFDQVFADTVAFVQGGAADREAYGEYSVGEATTSPHRQSPYSEDEQRAFNQYARVRRFRQELLEQRRVYATSESQALADSVLRELPDEWLLRLECLEILKQQTPASLQNYVRRYEQDLVHRAATLAPAVMRLVEQGIRLAASPL